MAEVKPSMIGCFRIRSCRYTDPGPFKGNGQMTSRSQIAPSNFGLAK
jgi:hypothetical protein